MYVDHGPISHIFGPPLTSKIISKIGQNSGFHQCCNKIPLESPEKLILSSLELLFQVCKIWALGSMRPKINRPNLSGKYLGDCSPDFHVLKAI